VEDTVTEPIEILVAAFTEGARQFTTYIALGTSAAASALVLDNKLSPAYDAAARVLKRESQPEQEPTLAMLSDQNVVKTPTLLGEVQASTARWILVALAFIAGGLASNALTAMNESLTMLSSATSIRAALCVYPSLATGGQPLGYISAAIPGLALALIAWREGRRVRKLRSDPRDSGAPFFMAYFLTIPYLLVAVEVHRLPC
jgi:hypothetical protein